MMYFVEETTTSRLQADMEAGKVTSRELVLGYFDRIRRYDSVPGGLNSVLELNPEALFDASRLDRMRREGKVLSKLHGIPVLLKDNINTADRLHTSAGALALKNHFAAKDAALAARLRAAGAVILGKANMTEYANYMSYNMPGGYSSRGGQVLCPYDPRVNPSGSSSGSAVSASASLCAAAVGTETSGSILHPAAVNGIVGLKPTAGLIDGSGIFPISFTLDTAGPMARTVEDAAVLLDGLAGGNYSERLTEVSLDGLRIGVSRMPSQPKRAGKRLEWLFEVLRENGATLIEIEPFEDVKEIQDIMRHEFRGAVDYYLSREQAEVRTLGDIIRFHEENAEKTLRYGQQRMLDAYRLSTGRHVDADYLSAMTRREEAIAALDRFYEEKSLDLILMTDWCSFTAYTGFPTLNLPLGAGEDGLPAASFWMARRFDEARLLSAAFRIEKLRGERFAPDLDWIEAGKGDEKP